MPAVVADRSMAFAPPASAAAASPPASARAARCAATSDDEHAVSVDTQGPARRGACALSNDRQIFLALLRNSRDEPGRAARGCLSAGHIADPRALAHCASCTLVEEHVVCNCCKTKEGCARRWVSVDVSCREKRRCSHMRSCTRDKCSCGVQPCALGQQRASAALVVLTTSTGLQGQG